MTAGAARSLLGKAYIYQDKFEEASQVLEEVINSGQYTLVSNYEVIFEHEGENGSEVGV